MKLLKGLLIIYLLFSFFLIVDGGLLDILNLFRSRASKPPKTVNRVKTAKSTKDIPFNFRNQQQQKEKNNDPAFRRSHFDHPEKYEKRFQYSKEEL